MSEHDPSAGLKRHAAIQTNRAAYDRMAANQQPLCRPASDKDFIDPLRTVDPIGWLGASIRGWKVLCLAAGGGRQSALYAAAGAQVTVVDISCAMLQLDRQVAQERRRSVRTIEASMDSMPMLLSAEFDAVIHPVSTCYLPDLTDVFTEIARVLRPGGLYISQHKQPVSLQAGPQPTTSGTYEIRHTYYRDKPVPVLESESQVGARLRERGAVEYLHRWEQLVGGICRSGFVVEDLVEPDHGKSDAKPGTFGDRGRFMAPYVRIKARRVGQQPARSAAPTILIPGSD